MDLTTSFFRTDHIRGVCILGRGRCRMGGVRSGLAIETGECCVKAGPGVVAAEEGPWHCVPRAYQRGIYLQGSTEQH